MIILHKLSDGTVVRPDRIQIVQPVDTPDGAVHCGYQISFFDGSRFFVILSFDKEGSKAGIEKLRACRQDLLAAMRAL